MEINWKEDVEKKYQEVTDDLPQFHRSIAKVLVKEKAEELAKERGSENVEISDLVKAFFQEVPPAFKDMMKRLLGKHGIEYAEYIKE